MSQRDKILALLRVNGIMTQAELAEAIYQDNLHMSNIYNALMLLVKDDLVIRLGAYPAKYALCGTDVHQQNGLQKSSHAETRQYQVQQEEITMSAECAVGLILEYFHATEVDRHGRYLSWEHCYQAFLENRNKTDDQTVDYLALHLAFYLASWGMYRGSSFLLQKDYKVHIPIIQIIQEKRYYPLCGISAEELSKEENLHLLGEIGSRIRKCYAEERSSFADEVNHATDTLITKILLGTLGCVPAYDRYYMQAVKKHHISNGKYNKKSVYGVAKFYCDNLDVFEKLRQELSKRGIEYPPMKLMDMCFWQDAYLDDLKQK